MAGNIGGLNNILPAVAQIGVCSRQTNLGVMDYALNNYYSPDTGYEKSKVLDLVSPIYSPNKNYIFDRSSYNNHGIITGASWTRLSSGLPALDFDGTDDQVNCGSGASLDDMAAFTLDAWIYPDTIGEGNAGRIFSKENGAPLVSGLAMYLQTNNTLFFGITVPVVGTCVWYSQNNAITLGKWQKVIATCDGTTNVTACKLYVNDVLCTMTNPVLFGVRDSDAGYNLLIGGDPNGARNFDGKIALATVKNSLVVPSGYSKERWMFNV